MIKEKQYLKMKKKTSFQKHLLISLFIIKISNSELVSLVRSIGYADFVRPTYIRLNRRHARVQTIRIALFKKRKQRLILSILGTLRFIYFVCFVSLPNMFQIIVRPWLP